MDWHQHRFDADPYPDPIFHFDADPDPDPHPDPGPNPSYTSWKSEIYFPYFAYIKASLHCFIFLFSVTKRFQNFQYFGQYIEGFLEKKVFLGLIFR
jgi:hypothetical protein